jgi:16S rRNA (guanine1207-N2)-methyltransferase
LKFFEYSVRNPLLENVLGADFSSSQNQYKGEKSRIILSKMSDAAQSLILKYLQPNREDKILVLEGGDGRLANQAAKLVPDGQVISLARDIRAVEEAQNRLEIRPNASATLDVFPNSKGWDYALLPIPKERRYARCLLLASWEALKPEGQLLLAGPSKGGAKAVIKDAERLFGNTAVLGYRSHQRVAVCLRGETLPEPLPREFRQPGIAPNTQHTLQIDRPEGTLSLETHAGIFSWEELDEGTALLLANLNIKPGSQVWDVGCGYGVLGLSAALAGAKKVIMSDVNLIAVHYTKKNASINNLDTNAIVFPANTLSLPSYATSSYANHQELSSMRYDLILSNPAFHQGRKVNKSMADELITKASGYLKPDGRLLIVANRFLNYDKVMRENFNTVSRIAETPKFHVLEAKNG